MCFRTWSLVVAVVDIAGEAAADQLQTPLVAAIGSSSKLSARQR